MVAKHVHAAVITRLNQLARDGSGCADRTRDGIRENAGEHVAAPDFCLLVRDDGPVRTVTV